MKEFKIEVNVKVYQYDELSVEDKELVERAKDATRHSYARYSRFYVGAALRLEDGTIQIAAQSMQPHLSITTLAIAARNDSGFILTPITPCGACRQVILEMEDRYNRPIRILLYGENGVYELSSVKDLLPLSFVDANMKF